jgi:hypothetical protein
MAWKRIGILALLALSASAALMQDASPEVLTTPFPEVVIYEPETGALYNVTAEGTQQGANLSDVPAFAGQTGYNYMLSPDRSKLVFVSMETISETESSSTYYIADVASGACCEKLDPQDPMMNGVLQAVFSPDGTQLAAAYHSATYEMATPGQVVVFDLATGSVVARLTSDRLDNSIIMPGTVPPGILFTEWDENGLLVWPSCVGCEPAMEGLGQYWNPADDSLSDATVPFSLMDLTLATGERLRATMDASYPNNPEAMGMLPVPNVLTYAPASTDPLAPLPTQVIYFNPNNIYINRAQWVADGQAVLIIHSDQGEWFMQSDEAYILLRDGTQVPLTIPMTRQFLAQTSDGWVMTDTETSRYIYYRLTGATVEEIPLDVTYTGYPVVVETPDFGASVPVGAMFPAIAQP